MPKGMIELSSDRAHLATKADLYQMALGIIVANAAITSGLLTLVA